MIRQRRHIRRSKYGKPFWAGRKLTTFEIGGKVGFEHGFPTALMEAKLKKRL